MDAIEEQGFKIFDMPGYIAKDAAPAVGESFDPHLTGTIKEFVLDMHEVKTLFSSMASVIVHIIKKAEDVQGKLYVVNVCDSVLNAFNSLHLSDLVKVYETALDFEMDKGLEIEAINH